MPNERSSIFFNRLRYWSIHSIFCAGPSFLLAYLAGYSNLAAILGMLTAILTFILIYTFVSSSDFYQKRASKQSFLGKIIHRSAMFRSALSILGLSGIAIPSMPYLSAPDIYAGFMAVFSTEYLFKSAGIKLEHIRRHAVPEGFWLTSFNSFFPTYLTAFIEGVIITASLLAIILCFSLLAKMAIAFLPRHPN